MAPKVLLTMLVVPTSTKKAGSDDAVLDFGHSRSSLLGTLSRSRSIWSLMSLKSRTYFGLTISVYPQFLGRHWKHGQGDAGSLLICATSGK